MSELFDEARRHYRRDVIEHLFTAPGARWENGEYLTLSPLRPQTKIKSFSINESGVFNDFSSGDGGDLIDLVSQSQGVDKVEAAKTIILAGGGLVPEQKSMKSHSGEAFKSQTKSDEQKSYIPDTPEVKKAFSAFLKKEYFRDKYGSPVKAYAYRNYNGKILFYTVRFEDGNGGKQVLPFYYTTANEWKCKRPPVQRFPLYGVEKLKGNDLPYMVVEGEKCADQSVEGYVLITWIGGSKAVEKSDWKVLEGREGIIFPDIDQKRTESGHLKKFEDQPGMSAALKIKGFLPQSKILNIKAVQKRLGTKDGWDVADAIEAGVDVIDLIKAVGFCYDREISIDPYDMYKVFISERYGDGNIDQIDGLFFRYNEKKHYWKNILQENIKPDIKTWLEKNGMIEVLKANKKNPKTIINDIDSYVTKHALDYIDDNPFRESAISPWIHHKSGAIQIKNEDFTFFNRKDHGEQYFKDLYPLVCLDYGIDKELYENMDLKRDCPAFYYYVSELIPNEIKGTPAADEEIRKTIEMFSQILAYSFSPIKKDEFFFGLVGKEGTGKSFFVELLKELIGEDFIVERRIKDTENRFAASDLFNSKVFIEPDMASNVMLPDDFIKSYAGNKSITIENKFEKPIKGVKISISMFIVSNHEIKVSSIAGVNRRLILIKFGNTLKRRDKLLKDRIIGIVPHGKESGERSGQKFDERPAILALALKGWKSFTANNHSFTTPKWVDEEKDKWSRDANTAMLFIQDSVYEKMVDEFQHYTGKELLDNYQEWAKEEGIKHPYGRKRFYEEIKNIEGVSEYSRNNQKYFKILHPDSSEDKKQDEIPF